MKSDPFEPERRWWKPSRRTVVIVLATVSAIALLAGAIFSGRDTSGDAAGQGLASAFEATFFALGAGCIVLVALVAWLSQHFRPLTTVIITSGLLLLAIVGLIT